MSWEAHGIPYMASASPAYPLDLYDKVAKAKTIHGTRYIQINIPCPPGWGFPTDDLVKLGKLAVDTAIWVLFEIEDGLFRLTGRSRKMAKSGKKKTVDQYVKLQERFRQITPDQVDHLQAWVDNRWEQFRQRHNSSHQQ